MISTVKLISLKNGVSSSRISFQPDQSVELLTSGDVCAGHREMQAARDGRKDDTTFSAALPADVTSVLTKCWPQGAVL